jgi:hypothetical protein
MCRGSCSSSTSWTPEFRLSSTTSRNHQWSVACWAIPTHSMDQGGSDISGLFRVVSFRPVALRDSIMTSNARESHPHLGFGVTHISCWCWSTYPKTDWRRQNPVRHFPSQSCQSSYFRSWNLVRQQDNLISPCTST